MKIRVILFMLCFLLDNGLLASVSQNFKENLPISYMLEKYNANGESSGISRDVYFSLDMYFPSKYHLQSEIKKHKASQQELNYEKIIDERDLMIHKSGWELVLNKFDFNDGYGHLSEQFREILKDQYKEVCAAFRISCSDVRIISIVDSVKRISWENGIELLRQTYSAEGTPQSLEDAVALVFLHIYPPRPYSPSLFTSLCSRFSESYRSTSEAARLEHNRKEKEDFIFFMKCMANAIAMIEKRDPQELFGYDAVEATTSFTITDSTTSSKVDSLESTSSSGTDGSAVVSRRTRSDSEKTLSSVGSISSESESSSSHSEKDSEKEDEKEE